MKKRQFQISASTLFNSCVLWLCLISGGLAQPQQLQYKILATEAHDPTAFTQGFEIADGQFFESSGLYGKSKILRYSADNSITARSELPNNYFAEGLTIFDGQLYLLTWREGKAFVYNQDSLKRLKSFNYDGEGWGLTHDDSSLIMSDGSDTLTFRSPKTFLVEKSLTATSDDNQRWDRLNELEYVDGTVWANRWQESIILGIDADSGEVVATVDITPLQRQAAANIRSVANGIAYDEEREAFWITGKYWRYRYLLKFLSREGKPGEGE